MIRISVLLRNLVVGLLLMMVSEMAWAQTYDGPVGKSEIPQAYDGFTNAAPQAIAGPPEDPCEFQDPLDPICPIDDGVYGLLAIGAFYGLLKFRNARKQVAAAH